jgi:PAS domain S-box-containing protein
VLSAFGASGIGGRTVAQRDSGVEETQRAGPRSRSALILWIVFLAACVGIGGVGRLYFDAQRRDIIAAKGAELSAIRDLKIEQIQEWRAGLLRRAKRISDDPSLRNDVSNWLANPNDPILSSTLRGWLAGEAAAGNYSDAVVISSDGSKWISLNGTAPPDAIELEAAKTVGASGEATMTDLFLDPGTGKPRLDVLAPLRAGGAKTLAVVVLHQDPSGYLFPLLQRWPTISPSSESLLFRNEKAAILYLNELRFKKDTALKFEIPKTNSSLLAVQAVTGPARTAEGVDYRGVPVYGALGRVGDSPWYFVAKIDQSEAFAGVTRSQWLISMAALVLLSFVGLGLLFAWRQRSVEYYRQQLETERSKALLSQQYRLLSRYASDAVILADENLHIVQANERASALYGYSANELLVMTLDDLLDHDEDGEKTSLAGTLHGEAGSLIEIRQRRANGSVIDAEMSVQIIATDEKTLYLTVTRDITERVAADKALRASEEGYRTLLEGLPAGVVVHAPDTSIQLSNPQAAELLGLSADQLYGRTAMDPEWHFLREDGAALPLEEYPVNRVVSSGQTLDGLVLGVLRSGRIEPVWLLCNAYPAHDASGELLQVVVTFIDVSDLKRAEEDLLARTEDLARSNAELEKFAYVASHDLQEPLRMVASYTQLLQRRYEGQLDDDADEFIAFAVDGATRMQRLINELLAYSRVGSQGVEFMDTDLEIVLGDVLKVLDITTTESGTTITHDPLPTVACDPTQIGQVFQNLLANAIKFCGDDPPRIHIGVESSAGEWVFSIQDNGLGVDPEYFDRIFVIFQRLQSRTEYPGTGMGLAICKRIIERHGGRIWIESDPGKGSTFFFTLRDQREADNHVG